MKTRKRMLHFLQLICRRVHHRLWAWLGNCRQRCPSQIFEIGFRMRLPDIQAQFVTTSRDPSVEGERARSEGPPEPKHGVGARLFDKMSQGESAHCRRLEFSKSLSISWPARRRSARAAIRSPPALPGEPGRADLFRACASVRNRSAPARRPPSMRPVRRLHARNPASRDTSPAAPRSLLRKSDSPGTTLSRSKFPRTRPSPIRMRRSQYDRMHSKIDLEKTALRLHNCHQCAIDESCARTKPLLS